MCTPRGSAPQLHRSGIGALAFRFIRSCALLVLSTNSVLASVARGSRSAASSFAALRHGAMNVARRAVVVLCVVVVVVAWWLSSLCCLRSTTLSTCTCLDLPTPTRLFPQLPDAFSKQTPIPFHSNPTSFLLLLPIVRRCCRSFVMGTTDDVDVDEGILHHGN